MYRRGSKKILNSVALNLGIITQLFALPNVDVHTEHLNIRNNVGSDMSKKTEL